MLMIKIWGWNIITCLKSSNEKQYLSGNFQYVSPKFWSLRKKSFTVYVTCKVILKFDDGDYWKVMGFTWQLNILFLLCTIHAQKRKSIDWMRKKYGRTTGIQTLSLGCRNHLCFYTTWLGNRFLFPSQVSIFSRTKENTRQLLCAIAS